MKRVLLILPLLFACSRRHPASETECTAVLDQLVALHLRQAGFRDQVLEKARAHELRPLLAPDLAACRRLRFTDATVPCARKAATVRDLAHDCLR